MAEADGLEDLGAAVGVDRRDAHLGQDLEDAVFDRGLETLLGFGGRQIGVLGRVGVGGDGLEGQLRANRVGTASEEAGDAMDVTGVVGDDDQAGLHPQASGNQVVVDRARRQQRRHRHLRRADAGVVDQQQGGAHGDGAGGFHAEAIEGSGEAARSFGRGEGGVEAHGGERGGGGVGERGDGGGEEEEGVEFDELGRFGGFGQQWVAGSQQGAQAHHQPLPEVIDGGVGDLGKALAEVVMDRAGPARQWGQGSVVTHRERRFFGVGRHRLDHHPQLLDGVAVGRLAARQGCRRRGLLDRFPVVQMAEALGRPVSVGCRRRDADLAVLVLEGAPAGVDKEHLARS